MTSDLFDDSCEKFLSRHARTEVGDPDDDTTVVGPMITEDAASKVEAWMDEAVRQGGSSSPGGEEGGNPAADGSDGSRTLRLQSAPRRCLPRSSSSRGSASSEMPSKRVNASDFGLQAGVFSNDLANVIVRV